MPGEDFNSTLRFDADITDYSAAMQEATRLANRAKSEFDVVASTMDDWQKSTEGLTAKLSQLSAEQQVGERKLEIMRAAYRKVVEEQGEFSKAAVDLETKINKQQATVNKTAREHERFAQKLAEVERGADGAADDVKKAGDAAKQAGEDARDAGEGWTIFKDVVADLVSNAISGLVDSVMGAAEATREYRRDLAQMAQNAADSGADMEVMKTTLEDVASITGEADAAMEGLNMLMASGLDTDGIVLASDALSGAATKFDGVKFEGIAEGLQETLAVGEAVGPFAEVIERTGGNLDTFNAGLADCTTEAERQQYVLDWLANSGLADVHDAYVQNNADLVEAEKAQFRLNDAMASVGAATEPIQTALANIGATILESLAPVIENIVTWVLDNLPTIAPIVTGIATALGVLAAALAIQGLISGVTKAFALLNTTMLANPITLIVAALAGLVAAFVHFWNTSEGFRAFWQNLWESVKGIVEPIWNAIVAMFKTAWENIKVVWDVVVSYFSTLWENIKLIFSAVGDVLSGDFSGAWEKIKQIFANWGDFFTGLWDGAKQIFANVDQFFGGAFSGAWDAIKNAWNGAGEWFSNVRQGINKAFENVGNWFKEKFTAAKNAAQNAWSGVKNFFSNVRTGVNNAFSNVDSWMSDKFGDSWTAIKKAFSPFVDYFKQIWNSVKGIFSAVKSVLSGNFSDAWNAIKGVFAGWGNFFSGLWDKVKSAFSNAWESMSEIGKNIVQGIWDGISNAFTWIKNKISGWVGNVMDFVKNLFGIHSPSAVMRDEVGKMLGLGMAEGIEKSLSSVKGAMRDLSDAAMGGLPSAGKAASGNAIGGKTINFTQNINSPKALTRREIYRQTHNALAHAGGM